MIPLRDNNPSQTTPLVNYVIIGINVLAFLIEQSFGRHFDDVIFSLGVIPARFLHDVASSNIQIATFTPFFTSMFLHGGWWHLFSNMLFLYIFGDNVEDRFGHFPYALFYLVAGFAAAGTQVFMNPDSATPMVGASGAIAGVLGAYTFMFPKAKVATLIPIFFLQVVELPAFLFLGFWFLMQIFSGVMSLGIGADAGGVAWWAHIGGFAVGAIAFLFLRKRPTHVYESDETYR